MKEKLDKIFSNTIITLVENQLELPDIKTISINQDFFSEEFKVGFNKTQQSEYFNEQMSIIKSSKGPTLYWFEFDNSKIDKNVLREKYCAYKNSFGKDYNNLLYRNTSSFKKNFDQVTNVLYVGKVETGFYSRIITHLGYATNKGTAGMQLHHWYADEIKTYGDLTLNFIEFSPQMIYLIALFEKLFAKELKPLIGRY